LFVPINGQSLCQGGNCAKMAGRYIEESKNGLIPLKNKPPQ
jgi:hypothetical protein